ncbi:zinc finger CCCH domain-containing protein 32 [Oryza brachyantha]|uniref:C3H1-type domain-containing protein n=1 Tax=Oryza brachyantha TaxID=4533 RepID=J3M2I8_ORYBR|nr:zinc finger CCCH domain-containing protein 32 [Oryza brachyantha]
MEADGAAAAEASTEAGASASARPLAPEEEALRRNTDCVYFLASPLTCKKGNECDFRHSEGARMNPRDCWYWLNSNCLNPKCPFRHPPIDGMFGAPTPGIPAVPSHYAPYNSGKQMVPCYYFQKGNCLKGDRCAFYHGPQSIGNNPPEPVAKVTSLPLEQPQTQKNDLLFIKDSVQPNNSIQQGAPIVDDRGKMAVDRSKVNSARTATVAVHTASNAVSWPKSEMIKNTMPAFKESFAATSVDDHPESYQNHLPMESDPERDWNQSYEMPSADDLPQNSREADELLGESSPGFDVLVDNNADGAAYLHDEDFGGDMYPVEDYEYAPADFDVHAHHERDRFNGSNEQDQVGHMYDGYERKRRRSSSERSMERPFHSERRFLQGNRNPVEMDGSDLRHRLRRRRINESSLAISPERNGEHRRRDERYRDRDERHRERAHSNSTHRDRHQGSRGSTLSSRLQGRIKLPGRSPDRVDTHSEKERDRRRLCDRLSPVRRMEYQGDRHMDAGQCEERTRRRSSELALGARNADGQHSTREVVDSRTFSNRKTLRDSSKEKSVEPEASLDFEGPKPLSVILQRKREAAWGNGSSASPKEDKSAEVSRGQPTSLPEVEKEGENIISSEEYKSGSGDEEFRDEGHIPFEGHGQSSSHGDRLEGEDIIEVDPVENQDAEKYDQREGESYYEAIEGQDYKSEDENAYEDDEEFDDDDDDFARKVGVVFS